MEKPHCGIPAGITGLWGCDMKELCDNCYWQKKYWDLHLSYCYSVVFNVVLGIYFFINYYLKPLLGG